MNDWDLYEKVDGRDFNGLIKILKNHPKYNTHPIEVIQWGNNSLGYPWVVIKHDRPQKKGREESVPVADKTVEKTEIVKKS